MPPAEIARVLEPATRDAWDKMVDILPSGAYLVGGTGLAVHLAHRVSRDLDFYLAARVDLDALQRRLEGAGRFVTLAYDDERLQTLNGVLDGTKVQFLDAREQTMVDEIMDAGGLPVAGMGDLLATKLNVLMHRPALRDYYDLQVIEERAHRYVEEGLALALARYRPRARDQYIRTVLQCLASFADVEDEPQLRTLDGRRVSRGTVERYWRARLPVIVRSLDSGEII